MSTTTKIIRAVMKKAKDNPEKLSTKAAKATVSSVKGVKKAIKDVSLDKAKLASGKAVESISKGARKAGESIAKGAKKASEMAEAPIEKAKSTGSWIKKHPVKTGLGAAAVAGGAAAMSDDDDLSSEIKKIKAKDPSERTAAEKRLLRIMEEE